MVEADELPVPQGGHVLGGVSASHRRGGHECWGDGERCEALGQVSCGDWERIKRVGWKKINGGEGSDARR